MPRICQIEIEHFRCIRRFKWLPRPGFNALVGPGDVGKSTVLDAIDYCLGARHSISFTDADFNQLDETRAIRIAITVGDLRDDFLDLDMYGMFLRGFDSQTATLFDEPTRHHLKALTIVL